MQVIGNCDISGDMPCRVCGDPLILDETEPLEVAGIFCPEHRTTHVYHVGCLTEDVQVELMIAQMRHQGMIK